MKFTIYPRALALGPLLAVLIFNLAIPASAWAVDGTNGATGPALLDADTGQVFDSQDPPHTFALPNATKTATGHGTVTITAPDIATVTPQAGAIPMARTDTKIDPNWVPDVTDSNHGLMTPAQKVKLDSLTTGTLTMTLTAVQGTGTAGSYAKWTGTDTIGNGLWQDDGTTAWLPNGGRLTVPGLTNNSSAAFGALELQSYSTNNAWLANNLFYNGSSWVRRATGKGSIAYFVNGGFEVRTAPDGAAGTSVAAMYTRMSVNDSGGVGIGGAITDFATMAGAALAVFDGKLHLNNLGSTTNTNLTNLSQLGGAYVGIYPGSINADVGTSYGLVGRSDITGGITNGAIVFRRFGGVWESALDFYVHPSGTASVDELAKRLTLNTDGASVTGALAASGNVSAANISPTCGASTIVQAGTDSKISTACIPTLTATYATTATLTNYATTAFVTSTLTNYAPISTLTNYVSNTQKGAANGVATLDGSTKVPSSQLNTGTGTGQIITGADSRLSDPRPSVNTIYGSGVVFSTGTSTVTATFTDVSANPTIRPAWGTSVASESFGQSGTAGTSNTVARADHAHQMQALPSASTSTPGIIQIASSTPSAINPGNAGQAGVAGTCSAYDHQHYLPYMTTSQGGAGVFSTSTPQYDSAAGSAGPNSSGQVAQAAHSHPMRAVVAATIPLSGRSAFGSTYDGNVIAICRGTDFPGLSTWKLYATYKVSGGSGGSSITLYDYDNGVATGGAYSIGNADTWQYAMATISVGSGSGQRRPGCGLYYLHVTVDSGATVTIGSANLVGSP